MGRIRQVRNPRAWPGTIFSLIRASRRNRPKPKSAWPGTISSARSRRTRTTNRSKTIAKAPCAPRSWIRCMRNRRRSRWRSRECPEPPCPPKTPTLILMSILWSRWGTPATSFQKPSATSACRRYRRSCARGGTSRNWPGMFRVLECSRNPGRACTRRRGGSARPRLKLSALPRRLGASFWGGPSRSWAASAGPRHPISPLARRV